MRSPRPTSSNCDSNTSAALLTSSARCRVFASCRKAASANRVIQGAIVKTRRSGMSSTPPNATNSRQKLEQLSGRKWLKLLGGNVTDIAKGRAGSRRVRAVDEQHAPPRLCQRPRDSTANDASPNDRDIRARRGIAWSEVSHALAQPTSQLPLRWSPPRNRRDGGRCRLERGSGDRGDRSAGKRRIAAKHSCPNGFMHEIGLGRT